MYRKAFWRLFDSEFWDWYDLRFFGFLFSFPFGINMFSGQFRGIDLSVFDGLLHKILIFCSFWRTERERERVGGPTVRSKVTFPFFGSKETLFGFCLFRIYFRFVSKIQMTFVQIPKDSDFSFENLPFGVFSTKNNVSFCFSLPNSDF